MGKREYEPGNRLLQSALFSTKRKNEKSARSIMIKTLGFDLQKSISLEFWRQLKLFITKVNN